MRFKENLGGVRNAEPKCRLNGFINPGDAVAGVPRIEIDVPIRKSICRLIHTDVNFAEVGHRPLGMWRLPDAVIFGIGRNNLFEYCPGPVGSR